MSALNPRYKKSRFWQRIQGQVILVLLTLLVPIFLIQVYLFNEWYKTKRDAELQADLQMARAVSKTFEGFVKDVLRQELAVGLALTASTLPVEEQRQIIEQNIAAYPEFMNLLWVSPEGIVRVSHLSEMEGQTLSERQYFKAIVPGHEWSISDLQHAMAKGQPVVAIARGIRNKQGRLLGVMVASILAEQLGEVLAIERPEGGGHALVDSSGMLVYRYPPINPTWGQRNWLRDYPEFGEALSGKEVSKIYFSQREGKNRLVGIAPIPSIGWAASAGRTEEIAMRPVVSHLLPQAALLFVIAAAAFGAACMFSRFISNSVTRLRNHAVALGARAAQGPVVASGPAEIKELADSLDEMAEKLQSREICLREMFHRAESLARFPDENPNPILRISKDGQLLYANRNSSQLLQSLGWEGTSGLRVSRGKVRHL